MFQGLFKRAERSIDQAVSKIVARAMVAVPLLIATGFATAALTVKLVELYGEITGYALMAALFAVVSLLTVAIVGINGTGAPQEERVAETEKAAETTGSSDEQISDVGDLLTPELKSLLASAAPVAVPGLLRGVGRNLPLIFILAIVAFVISQFAESPESEGPDESGDTNATGDTPDPSVAVTNTPASAAAAA